MRQKRAKSYKKQMNVYTHAFKFRAPFQIIVDSELVLTCEKASFDIVKGLNRTIQSETKPMITQCCMQALYKTNNQKAIEIAKGFERRRCNHQPSAPEEPSVCIDSIVNVDGVNKHRYIVASQDPKLRQELRKVPGVPIIFMNRSVMVMEPLSKASAEYAEAFEASKLTHGLNSIGGEKETSTGPPVSKKRKGPKEPNPLSIKKKKTEPTKQESDKNKKKRRRKHNSKNDKGGKDSDNQENDKGEQESGNQENNKDSTQES